MSDDVFDLRLAFGSVFAAFGSASPEGKIEPPKPLRRMTYVFYGWPSAAGDRCSVLGRLKERFPVRFAERSRRFDRYRLGCFLFGSLCRKTTRAILHSQTPGAEEVRGWLATLQ